jgi:transcriptional regulator GlxA family with amidase domain
MSLLPHRLPSHTAVQEVLMQKATTVTTVLISILLLVAAAGAQTKGVSAQLTVGGVSVPQQVNVAFVISDSVNVIDFAGPWEVFADVMTNEGDNMHHLMHAYTVAADRKPINSRGVVMIAQYTFDDAPQPDIVVIPAQSGSPALVEWLRKQNARKAMLLSVCTGASILAESGLIDGHPATSHHEALEYFAKQYPKVKWLPGERYVHSTDNIYTAGGLTSGIDLALHIVELKFGRAMAQSTADYLEYRSNGWKPSDAAVRVRPGGTGDVGIATTTIARDGATDQTSANTKVHQ